MLPKKFKPYNKILNQCEIENNKNEISNTNKGSNNSIKKTNEHIDQNINSEIVKSQENIDTKTKEKNFPANINFLNPNDKNCSKSISENITQINNTVAEIKLDSKTNSGKNSPDIKNSIKIYDDIKSLFIPGAINNQNSIKLWSNVISSTPKQLSDIPSSSRMTQNNNELDGIIEITEDDRMQQRHKDLDSVIEITGEEMNKNIPIDISNKLKDNSIDKRTLINKERNNHSNMPPDNDIIIIEDDAECIVIDDEVKPTSSQIVSNPVVSNMQPTNSVLDESIIVLTPLENDFNLRKDFVPLNSSKNAIKNQITKRKSDIQSRLGVKTKSDVKSRLGIKKKTTKSLKNTIKRCITNTSIIGDMFDANLINNKDNVPISASSTNTNAIIEVEKRKQKRSQLKFVEKTSAVNCNLFEMSSAGPSQTSSSSNYPVILDSINNNQSVNNINPSNADDEICIVDIKGVTNSETIRKFKKGKFKKRKTTTGLKDRLKTILKTKVKTPKKNPTNGNILDAGDNTQKKTGLRPIIIDGSNVAFAYSNDGTFSTKGIEIVLQYFKKRGHKEIIVFVPQFRLSHNKTTDKEKLRAMEKEGVLKCTPSRLVNGVPKCSYDDRYIVQVATLMGGVVVSNDRYRDLEHENIEWKKTIDERLLMYNFVNDIVIFPLDPLGKGGPTLDQFLSF